MHPHPEQERIDRVTEWWKHVHEVAYKKCLVVREELDKMVVKQLDMLSDKDVILSDHTELNRLQGTINQKILSFGMELAEVLEGSASRSVVKIECGCDLKGFLDKEQINIISQGVLSATMGGVDSSLAAREFAVVPGERGPWGAAPGIDSSLAARGFAVVPVHRFFVFAVTIFEWPKIIGAKVDADRLAKAEVSAPKLVEKTAESIRLRAKQWFSDYLLGALLNVKDSSLQESLWLQCKTQLARARDSRLKYLKSVRPADCSATPPEVRQVQVFDWWETERYRAYKLASKSSERVWENVNRPYGSAHGESVGYFNRSYGSAPSKSNGYYLEMERACRELDNSLLSSAIEAILQIEGRLDQPELLYRLASHEEEKSLRSKLEGGMNTDYKSRAFDFLWDRAESKIDELYDVWSGVSPR